MTAQEFYLWLYTQERTPLFKVKNGKVLLESITHPNADVCVISRIVETGGKPLMLGLNFKSRRIKPDTLIEIVERGVN